jgi:hypothetical protein
MHAEGRFKKYSRQAGDYNETTGKVNGHDGKARRDIEKEVFWCDGAKAIFATIFNDKLVSKREKSLYCK